MTNRHSDPGWCLSNTEVCVQGHGCFHTRQKPCLHSRGGPGVSPSADHKVILLPLAIVFTDFQKENLPIVQATGQVRRPFVVRVTLFKSIQAVNIKHWGNRTEVDRKEEKSTMRVSKSLKQKAI